MIFSTIVLLAQISAQAPGKPVPLVADLGASSPNIVLQDNGATRFVVNGGDMPRGSCNLGDLVRKVKAHIEADHPEVMLSKAAPTLLSGSASMVTWFHSGNGDRCLMPMTIHINGVPEVPSPAERRRLAACQIKAAEDQEREAAEKAAKREAKLAEDKALLEMVTACSGSTDR